MMIQLSFGYDDAAKAINQAVDEVLKAGIHTLDIAIDKTSVVKTAEMGDALVERILASQIGRVET
jgi:3-isopropylmalate dehydrogenase